MRGKFFQGQIIPFSLEFWALGAIAAGIFLRIIHLGDRELWYDEVLSLLLSNGQKIAYQTPGDLPVKLAAYSALLTLPPVTGVGDFLNTLVNLLKGLVGGEPHPPLFYLSQHFWLYLFGNGEAGMRCLGVVISIGAIAISYHLGKLLLGHRGGLFLAALLAVNPFYLFHSLNLRMYGPLVFWTLLTTLSLLQLIRLEKVEKVEKLRWANFAHPTISKLLWTLLLIASVTAGCMTFYLFAYWMITLGVVVLFLDRQHWWQHGLRLGAGVLCTIPWALWGTLQQLRNADFGRFNAPSGFWASMRQHLQDVANTLAIHLLIGDWVTSLPTGLPNYIPAIAGFMIVGLLIFGIIFGITYAGQYSQPNPESDRDDLSIYSHHRLLILGCLLSLFPLCLALAVDIISGKFTLGFGWGRSMIFILPGSLLLMAILIMGRSNSPSAPDRWRSKIAGFVLLLYLGINLGDFTLRQREMFHQIADIISTEITTEPQGSTLIAMNSKAWGHVMRLAYYIPPTMPVMLLAAPAPELAIRLEKTLAEKSTEYDQVLWVDSHAPIWSQPTTETEKKAITKVLASQFQLQETWQLSGTMNSDEFTVQLYR
jgi:uncharacterized membrane protein